VANPKQENPRITKTEQKVVWIRFLLVGGAVPQKAGF